MFTLRKIALVVLAVMLFGAFTGVREQSPASEGAYLPLAQDEHDGDLPEGDEEATDEEATEEEVADEEATEEEVADEEATEEEVADEEMMDEEMAAVNPGLACVGTFGAGVSCLDDTGVWTTYDSTNSPLASDLVTAMTVCTDETFLVAVSGGLYTFDGTTWLEYEEGWDSFSSADDVACDAEGGFWVVYFQGASYFDGTTWTDYSSDNFGSPETSKDLLEGVAIAPDGNVWVVTAGSVAVFDGAAWTFYEEGNGFDDRYFFDGIVIDSAGVPWVAHSDGLSSYDAETDTWTLHETPEFSLVVETVGIDNADTKWVGLFADGVDLYDGTAWQSMNRTTSELSSNHVRAIVADGQDRAWLGTEYGLNVTDGISWTTYYMHNSDIADNDIYYVGVINDGPELPETVEKGPGSVIGSLSLDDAVTEGGIILLCVETLDSFLRDPGATPCDDQPLVYEAITAEDGTFSMPEVLPGRYYIAASPDGTLWAEVQTDIGLSDRVEVLMDEELDLGEILLTTEEEE